MSRSDKKEREYKTGKANPWLIGGVIVLIVLLLLWLTFADFLGDTDVAAFIGMPYC